MNPHVEPSASLLGLARSLWRNRQLIGRMGYREIVGRYQGSVMGLLWSVLNPILMLAIYTFVFSVVFQARWGEVGESRGQFAVVLFAGLIVHGLFAEVLNRSPQLVLSNVNYVKKVVFPLEILPVVQLMAAGFHALISVLVLLGAQWIIHGSVPATALLLPLVAFPLLLLTLGCAWVLASLGVFVRDVGQLVVFATTVLLFLSPVFSRWMRCRRPFSPGCSSIHCHSLLNRLAQCWCGEACRTGQVLRFFSDVGECRVDGFCLVSKNTQGICRCPVKRNPPPKSPFV